MITVFNKTKAPVTMIVKGNLYTVPAGGADEPGQLMVPPSVAKRMVEARPADLSLSAEAAGLMVGPRLTAADLAYLPELAHGELIGVARLLSHREIPIAELKKLVAAQLVELVVALANHREPASALAALFAVPEASAQEPAGDAASTEEEEDAAEA